MFIRTKNIEKAIYSYEKTNEIYDKAYWGDTPEEKIFVIDGEEALKSAKEKEIKLAIETLSNEVYYIFRWTLNHDKLIPYHVTMKRKTMENIIKGSSRYGSEAIRRELAYD